MNEDGRRIKKDLDENKGNKESISWSFKASVNRKKKGRARLISGCTGVKRTEDGKTTWKQIAQTRITSASKLMVMFMALSAYDHHVSCP